MDERFEKRAPLMTRASALELHTHLRSRLLVISPDEGPKQVVESRAKLAKSAERSASSGNSGGFIEYFRTVALLPRRSTIEGTHFGRVSKMQVARFSGTRH